jgi:alpha-beta hydrolase superfamily lysophospholipase
LPCPSISDRTIVLLHGYADAKVGAIAWAPLLLDMGFHVCAIDLRAHGESDGEMSTAGYFERHDLDAAINTLKARWPRETETIYLYGISLGGAVAIATAAMRDDVAGVVMDSPFADYATALRDHSRLLGSPGGIVPSLAARMAAWMSHADFSVVRPVELIARSRCPVLVFQGTADPITHAANRQQYAAAIAAAPAGSRQVVLEGVGHLAGFRDTPAVYSEALASFLKPSGSLP